MTLADLPGLRRAPECLTRHQLVERLLVDGLGQERVHGEARRHGVDAHPGGRRFERRAAGEGHHPGLGRRVVSLADLRPPAEDRGVVDDHARLALHHVAQGGARTAEGAVEGDVEHRAPLLVGHLRERRRAAEPGVVDEDVETSQLAVTRSNMAWTSLPRW